MTSQREESEPVLRVAELFSDLPVPRGETLSFEFEGLAKTLVQLARNGHNRTPFTVVVRGGWGRGKTTLLRRAEVLLQGEGPEGSRKVETLWFNAWKYPSEDTVLAGLLGALIDRLRKGGLLEQLKVLVTTRKNAAFTALLRSLLPEAVAEVAAQSRLTAVEEKRAFHDSFRPLFAELSRLLFDGSLAFLDAEHRSEETIWPAEKQRECTLAIFLDDLDRCRPERVAEVLEAITLFLDLPGVCFFLGVDWERLLAALPESIKAQGDHYLEKIVQVVLDLPTVSTTGAEDYLATLLPGSSLQAVLGSADGQLAGLAQLLENRHPRHVKRFLNDLSMTLAVLGNMGKLGNGEGQVPEAAVVAWHLLSEALPPGAWREARASVANAQALLRVARSREAPKEGEAALPAGMQRFHQNELTSRHLELLDGLPEGQLHVLVHLATPPAIVLLKAPEPVGSDLFVLSSGAWVLLEAKRAFRMGSAEGGERNQRPSHQVTLSLYFLCRNLVTNEQYRTYMEETGKEPPGHWLEGRIPEGKERHPVVEVSWADAQAFCLWLGTKLRAGGEKGVCRLPTEAEWEFAARGPEGREYPWGLEEPDAEHANYFGGVGGTTPVGSYPKGATPEGVNDLAGNVWEWCGDWLGPYEAESQADPTGPLQGETRVVRGGAFNDGSLVLRGASRADGVPQERYGSLGFRVVWSPGGGLAAH